MEGSKQVESHKHLEYRNVVMLLSDGLANEGIIDQVRICESVKLIYDGGISISTFGVGEDFDEDMLVDIADNAGGSFYFIATADDIPKFIEQEFQGLLATSAYNIEVAWKGMEGVKLRRVLGVPYEDRLASNTKLGDLRSGNDRLLILDVVLPPIKTEVVEEEILNFDIKWTPRTGPTIPSQSKVVCKIKYTTDENLLATENEDVLENVHMLEAAFVQYQAMELADQGDFSGAQQTMHSFQQKLGQRVAQSGSSQLKKVQEINEQMMEEVLSEKNYSKKSRKDLRSTMYSLRKQR